MSHVRDWYCSLVAEDWRGAVEYAEREQPPAQQLLVYPSFLAAPAYPTRDAPSTRAKRLRRTPPGSSRSPIALRRSRSGSHGRATRSPIVRTSSTSTSGEWRRSTSYRGRGTRPTPLFLCERGYRPGGCGCPPTHDFSPIPFRDKSESRDVECLPGGLARIPDGLARGCALHLDIDSVGVVERARPCRCSPSSRGCADDEGCDLGPSPARRPEQRDTTVA